VPNGVELQGFILISIQSTVAELSEGGRASQGRELAARFSMPSHTLVYFIEQPIRTEEE